VKKRPGNWINPNIVAAVKHILDHSEQMMTKIIVMKQNL